MNDFDFDCDLDLDSRSKLRPLGEARSSKLEVESPVYVIGGGTASSLESRQSA
jgi:hypothetical protein